LHRKCGDAFLNLNLASPGFWNFQVIIPNQG
jgi:hypothetical protein